MASDYPAPKAYIELIEKRYNLKVIDSHYILVDTQYDRYNMMLDVQFNDKMAQAFKTKYGQVNSAHHVAWEPCPHTNSIRFHAEIGNNILLLWDTLL
ncbi:hypothetical protein [Veillonella montpellierensis]|uniref:hypothetical protein n=1 Tax=Veillonella montpellierensis TaxID=187328 RepID=UPI000414CD3A|nr:hypothetical protein [Veillonella montpellierensis]